jgi:hypothetical protein
MMGNAVTPAGSTIRFNQIPIFIEGQGISIDIFRTAFQNSAISETIDSIPPNLSLTYTPTGPTNDSYLRLRWIAIDDTSVPSDIEPFAIQYSYRLEGHDDDWSEWSARTFVEYSHLPSGNYLFSVKAIDKAGNISPPIHQNITITGQQDPIDILHDNVIFNPGMEDGDILPDYWWTYNNGLTREVGWVQGSAHTGNSSIRIMNTTGAGAGWQGAPVTLSDPYPDTLVFGGWAKAQNIAAGSLFAIKFYVRFADRGIPPTFITLPFTHGTHNWENQETAITFDNTVKQIIPYCQLSATGDAWFDDIYVYEP